MEQSAIIPLINQQVRLARIRLDLDQQAVADAIDKKRPALSKIENGLQTVPNELIEFYNRKHNVSLEWLYRNEGDFFTQPLSGPGNTTYTSKQGIAKNTVTLGGRESLVAETDNRIIALLEGQILDLKKQIEKLENKLENAENRERATYEELVRCQNKNSGS